MAGFVEPVATGVHCIRVPNPAGITRNVYVIEGPTPTLIDGGHIHPASTLILQRGLEALHIAPAAIACIVLTDITPDRVGAALHPAFTKARVIAHAGAAAHNDYATFTTGLQRELAAPLLRDQRLAALAHPAALREALAAAFGGGGVLRAEPGALAAGSLELGNRRLVPLPIGGLAHEHLAYRLEPEGIVFSGDLPGSPAAVPKLLRFRGGDLRRLVAELRRQPLVGPLLPAAGRAAGEGVRTSDETVRVIEQARSRLQGLLCAGPREVATLVHLWVFGRKLTPLALARETGSLLVLAADLVSQGEADELLGGSTLAYRLSARALGPLRRTPAG